MKSFRVAIAYEEGFAINVEAENEDEAKEKAFELCEEFAGVAFDNGVETDVVHRDYFVDDTQED